MDLNSNHGNINVIVTMGMTKFLLIHHSMDRLWLLMVKAAETMETQVKNISTLSLAPLIQHSLTDSLSLYPPMPSGHAKSSYMWEERLVKVVFNKVIMTSADFSVTCTLSLHTHCLLLPLVWWGRKNYQKLFNSQILPPTTKYNCYEVEMVMLSSWLLWL